MVGVGGHVCIFCVSLCMIMHCCELIIHHLYYFLCITCQETTCLQPACWHVRTSSHCVWKKMHFQFSILVVHVPGALVRDFRSFSSSWNAVSISASVCWRMNIIFNLILDIFWKYTDPQKSKLQSSLRPNSFSPHYLCDKKTLVTRCSITFPKQKRQKLMVQDRRYRTW